MIDFIVASIIIIILGLAIYKLRKDKKNGSKCFGCDQCNTPKDKIKK